MVERPTRRAESCNHGGMIVSLLYQVTRRVLAVPTVLLRRDTAKDAELLPYAMKTPCYDANYKGEYGTNPRTACGSPPCPN
ncbi:hypothetical protein SANT12839_098080 [Streptomyces antimycoticus]|uniref:Uncharacterized protein n=1 Tax=Streptomyces antimycoticus TaxID=68175 RepID=A0A4D4KPU7_9ACTN|nr:hypothetical protein SANT12839_098080 [Streptomyces antimycoticus]